MRTIDHPLSAQSQPYLSAAVAMLAVLLLGLPALSQSTNSWPQWRGPSASGVAADANPPTEWSDTRNVLWKTPIPGRGHSTPIVWGHHVFVSTAIPVGPKLPPRPSGRPGAHDNLPVDSASRFVVISINRDTGALAWEKTVHQAIPIEGAHYTASLASASPVTDGTHVFAFFGSHGLHALDFDGNILWSKHFGAMHTKHGHGEGCSPVLFDDTLIINWDHEEQSFLAAIDKTTGNELWRRNRDEVTSWSTPLIAEVDGKAQVIVCGTHRVRGYDLASGEELWQCGGMSANIVATPVTADGILYVGSSYDKRALMAIKLLGASGDITDTEHVLWMRTRGTPYVPSPLLYDDSLYFLSHYQNVITRIDAKTGTDDPGSIRLGPLGDIYSSPVGAAGRVYVTDLEGVTLVFSHSPIPRMIAVNQLGEKVSASAAIAGNQLFLRGDKHLFCISEDSTKQ